MVESRKTNTEPVKPGDVVSGVVEQIMPYGAFVRLTTGQRAMVHISQLSYQFVKKVDDVLKLQQEIKAKVIKIDEKGRVDLSIKVLQSPPARSSRPAAGGQQRREKHGEDDFEKRLSSFLKTSDEKMAALMSNKNNGRQNKRRGSKDR